MRHLTGIISLSLALAGCALRQTPVPLAGDAQSIHMLTGSWAGDYSSQQTGRSGSITFELVPDNNSAYGDIVMIARPGSEQVAAAERQPGGLQIQRAAFDGGFTSPDKIEGTFHSRGNDFGHVPASGTWSVIRQTPGTR